MPNYQWKKGFGFLVGLVLGLSVFTACSYTTPEAENPLSGLNDPNVNCVSQDGLLSCKKDFFGFRIDQEKNEVTNARKKWMCGWAPLKMGGRYKGGLTGATISQRHCNMEFEISEDGRFLEVLQMNVKEMNDLKKWQQLILIPIRSHYFYEKTVDSRGREQNRYAKVTNKKNWKVAPVMDLDISNAIFPDPKNRPLHEHGFLAGGRITSHYDVEATIEKGERHFFGFTGTTIGSISGSLIQHEVRYNFYEIKDNPDFKETEYHQNNSQYMNILDIVAVSPDGIRQRKKAAHWDISKPIEFCLNGFDEGEVNNYRQVAIDVLDEMNKALQNIKAIPENAKVFVPSDRKLKHMFDLRCPSLTFINDPYLSMRAPLGIGVVNTNIRTGEILWGNAIVWGGIIDMLVNNYSGPVSEALAAGTNEFLRGIFDYKSNPYYEDIQNHINVDRIANHRGNFKTAQSIVEPYLDRSIVDVFKEISQDKKEILERHSTLTKEDREEYARVSQFADSVSDFVKTEEFAKLSDKDYKFGVKNRPRLRDALEETGSDFFTKYDSEDKYISAMEEKADIGIYNQLPQAQSKMANTLSSEQFKTEEDPSFNNDNFVAIEHEMNWELSGPIDISNRVENHYYEWRQAFADNVGLEKFAAARSVVKNVMLHELGHVVGLGHQFEGNRLPERGSVPDKIYKELVKESEHMHNYTSIMDYMNGRTEVNLPYEKVKMQYHDELVLSYLYKQQYATYKVGDDKFEFFDLPPGGEIPPDAPKEGYYTRYFPQCNDMDAWKGESPYCARWDRGFDAPTIINESFDLFNDSYIKRTKSFTNATGGYHWIASYRFWSVTYDLMNNARTFYDHLRYTLQDNKNYKDVIEHFKDNEKGLIEFSKACVDPRQASDEFKSYFAELALKSPIKETRSFVLLNQQKKSNYSQLLEDYTNVVDQFVIDENIKDILYLSPQQLLRLEDQLYKNNVALTEVNKLCRATKQSMDHTKILLSLKAPDHNNIDYDNAIVPTGIHGGSSSPDYSRAWGKYEELGHLPLKFATLDVFTGLSSTMRWGWWRLPKPKFADRIKGRYGYFVLYPEEFTDIIATAVQNNMGFGSEVRKEPATLSVMNLYMSYFLYRTFSMSSDTQARRFHKNFLDKLQAQTNFRVDVSVLILDSIKVEGKDKELRFGFNPKVYQFNSRELYDIPEAYLLENREVIVRPPKNQIIMPISKMRFLNQDRAYVWAIDVTYDKADYDDEFQGYSIKSVITGLTDRELNKCMTDPVHGLNKFFVPNGFAGFTVPDKIANDDGAMDEFEISIDTQFGLYKQKYGFDHNICSEQVKGVGLITSTALSIDGYIIRQIFNYIQ